MERMPKPAAEEADKPKRELPTTSPNFSCRTFIRELIRTNTMEKVGDFLDDAETRDYAKFDTEEELQEATAEYQDALSNTLTPEEKDALKDYTGYGYKYINQYARGIWNYEFLGERTPESIRDADERMHNISAAIEKAPSIGADIIATRGTNLGNFYGYNFESIADLASLEGQFFLETGFTSTAIVSEKSFAGRELDDPTRQECNIEMTYMIPGETEDAVALLNDEVSYSPQQTEYLLQRGMLSYVKEVKVDKEHNTAKLTLVVIPRSIYEGRPEAEA